MAENCGNGLHTVECLERNFMALQKKMEEDFSQVETIQAKVKSLSADWEERHQQLKIEQEKLADLEAQIKLLNAKQEIVMTSLQADMRLAASQIQEKEGLAERLRSEVAFLEQRVRVACEEAAGSAAELEKGAHEARLALEATLSSLCPHLNREVVASEDLQPEQEVPHLQQFPCGSDAERPENAEGAEATAEEALPGQAQEAAGGLLQEAKPSGSVGTPGFFWLLKKACPGVPRATTGQGGASCVQKPPTLLSETQGGLCESFLGRGENSTSLFTAVVFVRRTLLKLFVT